VDRVCSIIVQGAGAPETLGTPLWKFEVGLSLDSEQGIPGQDREAGTDAGVGRPAGSGRV